MAESLLIRADASPAIGTGHVMRCLTLARAARERGMQVLFATSASSEPLIGRMRSAGADIHRMESNHGGAEDAAEAVALAASGGIRHAVIDGYHFDGVYQQAFRNAGLMTLAVDDYGHAEHYAAHLVLNQNLGADADLYRNREEDTQLLIGPRYALLRPEFVTKRPEKRSFPRKARHILVTLGGADPENQTSRVLHAFSFLKHTDLEATVVIGSENIHATEIDALSGKAVFPIRVIRNAENMAQLMEQADLAIAAAGTTTWELLCMGVPIISGVIAQNQEKIAEALRNEGVAEVIGWYAHIAPEDLGARIDHVIAAPALRRIFSEHGRKIVDGQGVTRVLDALESLTA